MIRGQILKTVNWSTVTDLKERMTQSTKDERTTGTWETYLITIPHRIETLHLVTKQLYRQAMSRSVSRSWNVLLPLNPAIFLNIGRRSGIYDGRCRASRILSCTYIMIKILEKGQTEDFYEFLARGRKTARKNPFDPLTQSNYI